MRIPLIALALLLTSFSLGQKKPAPAPASGTDVLKHVTFVRVRSYSKEQLLAATGLKIGEPFTPDTLREAADRLAKTGAFSDVRYQYVGGDVEFQLPEQNELAPCIFENLVWLTPQEIESGLTALVPLYSGRTPTSGGLAQDISR